MSTRQAVSSIHFISKFYTLFLKPHSGGWTSGGVAGIQQLNAGRLCGGSIMVWGCSSTAGPGRLGKVEGNMEAESWRIIWLSLLENYDLGEDLFSNHTAKSCTETVERQQRSKVTNQSPDLNPIQNLLQDLKRPVCSQSLSNLTELELFVKNEEKLQSPDVQADWDGSSLTQCCRQRSIY